MRKLLKTAGRVVVGALLGLLVWLLVIDWVTVAFYNPHPAVVRYSSTSQTAFVHFTGVVSSGTTHATPLRELWSQHGDVIVVEYSPHRFHSKTVIHDTYRQLIRWGYQRAILNGSSMGGLLATDLIDLDRAQGNKLRFAVLMQDVPQGLEDLHQRGQAEFASTVFHPGVVTNWLLTDLFWNFLFNPPEQYMLGDDVDQRLLERHHAASSNYPLSGYAGQVDYIVDHRGYQRNQYVGIPLVVMQTDGDGVVKPTAEKWKAVFGGGAVIRVTETTHIGFVEYPRVWHAAYQQAFESLGPGW